MQARDEHRGVRRRALEPSVPPWCRSLSLLGSPLCSPRRDIPTPSLRGFLRACPRPRHEPPPLDLAHPLHRFLALAPGQEDCHRPCRPFRLPASVLQGSRFNARRRPDLPSAPPPLLSPPTTPPLLPERRRGQLRPGLQRRPRSLRTSTMATTFTQSAWTRQGTCASAGAFPLEPQRARVSVLPLSLRPANEQPLPDLPVGQEVEVFLLLDQVVPVRLAPTPDKIDAQGANRGSTTLHKGSCKSFCT
mmetsp:Transcript_3873/g.8382  ORF Transcript_3873/g.8382 Transcript_3873/m.8382 type:complete len:247 (-) Transcript_3873:8-748(-)